MQVLQKAAVKKACLSILDAMFFLGAPPKSEPDNWKFRRRLIYGSYRIAVAMIVFGAITFFFDTGVSNQLVIGGVALLSIIATAYTAIATIEDVKRNSKEEDY